jgi:hypothetical protein
MLRSLPASQSLSIQLITIRASKSAYYTTFTSSLNNAFAKTKPEIKDYLLGREDG